MANQSKYTFDQVEKKLDIIKNDQGEDKVLYGDGTYKSIPESTITDEQIATAVDNYLTENPIECTIDDEAVNDTTTWSSNKINELVSGNTTQIESLLQKYSELLNTIAEINGGNKNIQLCSVISMLDDWKFKLISSVSDESYSSVEETTLGYDDSSWDSVSVPHDWSIYNDFNSTSKAGYEGGYLDGGDAWYRKTLPITEDMSDKKVFVYFDGVYMETDVYINGVKVGINRMGYNPFYFDITEYVDFTQENVMAVFVRNEQPSSRWYSGSGIYRNVMLLIGETSDMSLSNVCVSTENLKNEVGGIVTTNIKVDVTNFSSNRVSIPIIFSIYYDGAEVGSSKQTVDIDANSALSISSDVSVVNPLLWSTSKGKANMYEAKVSVNYNGSVYYKTAKFGYRYIEFNSDGFYLNGEKIKLKGVCMHHDLGCIGAEINKSAINRQINILKDMGVNAIRLTHNPSSTEYLEACAENGILAIEEFFDCWESAKKTYDFARYFNDYKEQVIKSTIQRDINNPAIIMWSIGNEIIRVSSYTSDSVVPVVEELVNMVKKYDTTRPVTMGDDTPSSNVSWKAMEYLDVIGVNYGNDSEYSTIRNRFPDKCIYGSETTSALSSRGIYESVDTSTDKQKSSYDNEAVGWGDYAYAGYKRHFETYPYLAGMFVWTGFDYIGEPTPFNSYPAKSSYFGIVDTCGFPKDIYYMYQSRWSETPMIHILPHWDWVANSTINVWLYSNCSKVELFLNGNSLGSKLQSEIGEKYEFEYSISFEKGTLVANGYDENDNLVAQDIVYTSQETPATLSILSDKSSVNINSDDLVFIECNIVDKNGVRLPNARDVVTFTVDGGIVVGTDNGNASCVEKMRTNQKSAFSGKVLCVVRHDGASGDMTITATCEGLASSSVTVSKSTETTYTNNEHEFVDASTPPIYEYIISEVPCTGVELDNSNVTFNTLNGTVQLVATVTPENTTDTLIWSSSNDSVATVTNGLIKSVGEGNCIITAKCGEYSTTCNVTVSLSSESEWDWCWNGESEVPEGATLTDIGLVALENGSYAMQSTNTTGEFNIDNGIGENSYLEIDFNVNSVNNHWKIGWFTKPTADTRCCATMINFTGNIAYQASDNVVTSTGITLSTNTDYTIAIDNMNDKFYINGVEVEKTKSMIASNSDNTGAGFFDASSSTQGVMKVTGVRFKKDLSA